MVSTAQTERRRATSSTVDVAPRVRPSPETAQARRVERTRGVLVPSALSGASRLLLGLLVAVVPLQQHQSALGRLGRLVEVADSQWYLRLAVHGYAYMPARHCARLAPVGERVFFVALMVVYSTYWLLGAWTMA